MNKTIYDNALTIAHKNSNKLKGKIIKVTGPIKLESINRLLEAGAIVIMKGTIK